MTINAAAYLDGARVASGGELLDIVDPASDELVGRIPVCTASEVERLLDELSRCKVVHWEPAPPA